MNVNASYLQRCTLRSQCGMSSSYASGGGAGGRCPWSAGCPDAAGCCLPLRALYTTLSMPIGDNATKSATSFHAGINRSGSSIDGNDASESCPPLTTRVPICNKGNVISASFPQYSTCTQKPPLSSQEPSCCLRTTLHRIEKFNTGFGSPLTG